MYFPGILTANVGGKDRKNRKKVRVSSLFLDLICAPLFARVSRMYVLSSRPLAKREKKRSQVSEIRLCRILLSRNLNACVKRLGEEKVKVG